MLDLTSITKVLVFHVLCLHMEFSSCPDFITMNFSHSVPLRPILLELAGLPKTYCRQPQLDRLTQQFPGANDYKQMTGPVISHVSTRPLHG
jgi:hypothetical protein